MSDDLTSRPDGGPRHVAPLSFSAPTASAGHSPHAPNELPPPAAPSNAREVRSLEPIVRARGVRFVSAGEREEACALLARRRVLEVRVPVIEASARGRLADVLDAAIERELQGRGAPPPGVDTQSDADAVLRDQLVRARALGAMGLALLLGPLRAATGAGQVLEPEDSATLRFWAAATRERPVVLLLDQESAATGAYAAPARLDQVLGAPLVEEQVASLDPDVQKRAPRDGLASTRPLAPQPTIASSAVSSAMNAPLPTAPQAPPTRTPYERITAGASVAREGDAWRGWTLALTAARGPQPLAAFERLFAEDYLPLANAIAAGLDDARALHACEEFRRTFARAYADACPTFAVTGKRPRMVLDAPDLAARMARLHGARATQLLLVDALRFDLGAKVKSAVAAALGPRASLTDETVLWSALPTTSTRQLETLARGVDALRSAYVEGERDVETLRGRTADIIRRVKIGPRDVYKLDLVEARLREETPHPPANSFDTLATLAADAIARHAAPLPARTLLFVFGDHGFRIDKDGVPRSGGASPEEVLVPAFAFLLGEVH